jgi:dTDP-4-dehydrorhamnose 3,5-epimerase
MSINIIQDQPEIQGVSLKQVTVHDDERGSFSEVFRSEWVPGCNYGNETQLNLSRSQKGALRGLHYHKKQSDWWIALHGRFQAALADLRETSPTFGKTMVFDLSWDDSVCVLIPPGVAHGFLALTDASLLYAVDRFYDGTDEQGVAWNDKSLGIPWITDNPIVSERDMNNPTIEELRMGKLLPS